jgi:KDO2-lipid IV(A) lauroyltransferase
MSDSNSKLTPETFKFRHRLEFTLFNSLKRWGKGASKKTRRRGTILLDGLLYHGLRICRSIVAINLELAFPKFSTVERKQIARANYQWFARFCMDVLHMDAWKGRTSEIAKCHNLEILDQALSEKKGVLLISGHFGNWEMIPPALAELGYPVTMYVGRQTNPLTNELQNTARANFGVETIDKGKRATLQMGRALAANKIIAMLIDQNDNKSDLFVNFFEKLASSSKGTAAFHLLRKSPVVLVTCPYVGDHLEISFQRITFDLSGEQEKDALAITQKITSAFENVIRKYPEQYFWMHRRWRARPPEDSERIY